MSFAIKFERETTLVAIGFIDKLRHQAPPSIRHHRDFSNIKLIFRLLQRHLQELEECRAGDRWEKVELLIDANTRIKNHIGKKTQQMRMLATKLVSYEPEANTVIQGLLCIGGNLASIGEKLCLARE